MKVAVIGAGLAGLACTHELEKSGVTPVVFEMKDYIGEDLSFPALLLNIFNTPIKAPIKQLKLKYGIELQPHYELREMTMVGPSKSYTVKGKLGCIFRRGNQDNSLLHQVSKGINTPVRLNTFADIKQVSNEFDQVLLSSGNTLYTSTLKVFHETFNGFVRIASIRGHFRTDASTIWLNTEYAKTGFGYLVADTETEARLILIVPKVSFLEFEQYWNRFINGIRMNVDSKSAIDMNHRIGLLDSNIEGNLYYGGYAGCFIDSMMGFGSIKAIYSGADAAYCMINGLDYNTHMKAAARDMRKKYELRKAFDTFDNNDIDRFLALVNNPLIKQYIYRNPFFYATQGVLGAKIYNTIEGKRY